jgi:glycosyltransferase involved in cell wall biosynthesis
VELAGTIDGSKVVDPKTRSGRITRTLLFQTCTKRKTFANPFPVALLSNNKIPRSGERSRLTLRIRLLRDSERTSRIRRVPIPVRRTMKTMSERQPIEPFETVVPIMTVVVCTYNRTKLLRTSLNALSIQSIRDRVQVIVVDDGSTEDTAGVVADYAVEFVALGTNRGLSAARNAGVARARGLLVAFTDDDVIVPPDWCEALMDAWDKAPRGTRAIGGAVTVASATSITQRYLCRHNPLVPTEFDVANATTFADRLSAYLNGESDERPPIRPVYSLVGANMSFNHEALQAVGGFDPTIRFGGDEEKVCVNLRERFGDEAVIYCTSIVVAHLFERSLRDALRRSYLYGASNGRTWVRQGGIPGLRPAGGLFVTLLVVLAPISGFGAIITAFFVPFVVWRRWVKDAVYEHNAEVVTYPLFALAQELVANVGFFAGWRQERRRVTREKDSRSSDSTQTAKQGQR